MFFADTQTAIGYLRKALDISPEDPFMIELELFRVYLSFGIDYLEDFGENQKAITYFEQALEILPDDPEVLYYLGVAYMNVDNVKSKRYLQEAIRSASATSGFDHIVQKAEEKLLECSK